MSQAPRLPAAAEESCLCSEVEDGRTPAECSEGEGTGWAWWGRLTTDRGAVAAQEKQLLDRLPRGLCWYVQGCGFGLLRLWEKLRLVEGAQLC